MWIVMEKQRAADLPDASKSFEYNGNVWGPYDRREDADKVAANLYAQTLKFYPRMEFVYAVKRLQREVTS